ncbi:MAG: M48 family metallopeptidase [Gemmobacter sp.]|nr:M48 family metallopeptidase [Gemmobacter sp.]
MRWIWQAIRICCGVAALAGCAAPTPIPPTQGGPQPVLTPREAARNFVEVVERVEPVAESICRQETGGRADCDFQIVIDRRMDIPPNAFQTLDERGRPIVGFTLSLIADARNADEIAFVLGHEASHHILGHIPRKQQKATAGAVLGQVLGRVAGADAATLDRLETLGAAVGARRYSRNFELEADALGAVIAWHAGFDPVTGAGFFSRLPDPGDEFLGSHPPNAERQAQVAAVVRRLEERAGH